MWQTKHALAVPKNLGLGFDFQPYSKAYFLSGKCFTCVTKTIANLTTYRRKSENFNGTIIFEFDFMKNSSPINLNLCQT